MPFRTPAAWDNDLLEGRREREKERRKRGEEGRGISIELESREMGLGKHYCHYAYLPSVYHSVGYSFLSLFNFSV